MNIIQTKGAPAAIGPYSQGISTGKLLFTSGQLPVNPADGAMPEGCLLYTSPSPRDRG